jgi:hypothetical protein
MDFDKWMKGQTGAHPEKPRAIPQEDFGRAVAPAASPTHAPPVMDRSLPVVIPGQPQCQYDLFKPDGDSFGNFIPEHKC